ncbi:MAG: hypothetical protein ACO3A2_06515 [Bdellovibrionia bacterium]
MVHSRKSQDGCHFILMGVLALGGLIYSPPARAEGRLVRLLPSFYPRQYQWAVEDGETDSFQRAEDGVKSVPLVRVTSDAMPGFVDVEAEVAQDLSLLGFRLVRDHAQSQRFSLEQIAEGVDFVKDKQYSVVHVTSHALSAQEGGGVDFVYLNNGITGAYKTFKTALLRNHESWQLQTAEVEPFVTFSTMFLQGNWLFGRIIGISKVEVK